MAPAPDEPEHDVRPDLHLVADPGGELLCRIAERDLEAFEILYARYARPVYGLALRRLCDREGAADATRLAFAAIWNSAATFVPERTEGARWLFTVARNAIVDHAPAPSRAQLAAAEPEDGWLAFRVHTAVADLPEQERELLELAYWGGRSPSEVAELLGLSLDTFETRARSALTRLAVRLEDSDERAHA
jgi:RNA polymerase sigma-70 factor (ECF subfamily)